MNTMQVVIQRLSTQLEAERARNRSQDLEMTVVRMKLARVRHATSEFRTQMEALPDGQFKESFRGLIQVYEKLL
jgi:hypothetical protein